MGKTVVKTVNPYEGLVLQIVENDEKYEILVNGETETVEFCIERAYETLQQILDRFTH